MQFALLASFRSRLGNHFASRAGWGDRRLKATRSMAARRAQYLARSAIRARQGNTPTRLVVLCVSHALLGTMVLTSVRRAVCAAAHVLLGNTAPLVRSHVLAARRDSIMLSLAKHSALDVRAASLASLPQRATQA